MSCHEALSVGDVIAATLVDVPGLWFDGPAGWYALTCRPQREEAAERWLAARGVYAFHPVVGRMVRVRGHVRDYTRRYLPGYVFARFAGVPRPFAVMTCPFLTGALCLSSGHWGQLHRSGLRALHAMRAVDAAQEARRDGARARKAAAARLRVGDTALFRSGPMAGQRCEVVELTPEFGARVRLTLFGGLVPVKADVQDLVKLHLGT